MSKKASTSAARELTIFSTGKPFQGHNAIIQRNAMESWRRLEPACDVILFGSEEGAAEIASALGFRHVPEVTCNEYGTPLIGAMFNTAATMAKTPVLCYVNADIILFRDFLPALARIVSPAFLAIGRRWDLDVPEPLDYALPDWDKTLRTRLKTSGELHAVTGIDYFVFNRDLYGSFPLFAIGRGGWDNWLIYQARKLGAPVIDATPSITIIHQNHDYGHIADAPSQGWKGAESERNISLMGGLNHAFTLEHATHLLAPEGLRPARKPRHLYFRLRAVPVLHPAARFLLPIFQLFEKAVKLGRAIIRRRATG